MVFVGPASREDKGFEHSYDVVVDSYQSEEDLSDPDFYKMAGRVRNYNIMLFYRCLHIFRWLTICCTQSCAIMIVMKGICGLPSIPFSMYPGYNSSRRIDFGIIPHLVNLFRTLPWVQVGITEPGTRRL